MKSTKWLRCFLIVALAAVFPACGSTPPGQTVDTDSTLLALFPVDSTGILFFDVDGLREMEFFREFLVGARSDADMPEELRDFVNETGLDPIDDVQQLIAGRAGEDQFLGAVRFRGDLQGAEEFFEQLGTVSESHEGRSIYRPEPEEDWGITFVNDLAILGSSGAVRSALDRMAGGPSVLDNAETMAEIQALGDGNQVWGFGSVADLVPEDAPPPVAMDLVAALERVTYRMRLESGVTARMTGTFTTADTATRAGDLLRGFLALGMMGSADQPDVVELLSGVQVQNVETAVEIDFSVPQELLDRLAESMVSDPSESSIE